LIENVEEDVGMMMLKDERWSQADCLLTIATDENAFAHTHFFVKFLLKISQRGACRDH